MSFEQFDRYWDTTHAGIVTSVPEFTRYVRRYVQAHLVPEYSGIGDSNKLTAQWGKADFDGIAELWFDSTAEMIAAFNDPQFIEKIAPDDQNFVDADQTQLFVLRELEKFTR